MVKDVIYSVRWIKSVECSTDVRRIKDGARADQEVGGVGLARWKTLWHRWRPWLPQQQQRNVVLQLICIAGELKGSSSHLSEIVAEPGVTLWSSCCSARSAVKSNLAASK